MNRITVKDSRGIVIGFIETSERGDKIVRDSLGKYLGRYESITNSTLDSLGRQLYKGDQSSLLLASKK